MVAKLEVRPPTKRMMKAKTKRLEVGSAVTSLEVGTEGGGKKRQDVLSSVPTKNSGDVTEKLLSDACSL